jgi:hypothetical protein
VVFPLPFGRRHSLLGHPIPARELGPPHGRLTGPESGPRRGYHVPHARAAIGLGALCAPRTTVLTPDGATSRPASAASQRHVPVPAIRPIDEVALNEASTKGSHMFARPIFPSLWPPGWNGPPLGFPGLRTPPTKSRTTHARAGTGHRARTWNYTLNSSSVDLQSDSSLVTCDLVSQVAKR